MQSTLSPEFCQLIVSEGSTSALSDFIAENHRLYRQHPEIRAAIKSDQTAHGLEKKRGRAELKDLAERRRDEIEAHIPGLESVPHSFADDAQEDGALLEGRRRMKPLLLFVLLMLRGRLGSVTDQASQCILHDSRCVAQFLAENNLSLPARSTISENLNCLSAGTLQLVLQCQLADAHAEGMDDFTRAVVDSTPVGCDMEFTSDYVLVRRAVERLADCLDTLRRKGLSTLKLGLDSWESTWRDTVVRRAKECSMASGKDAKSTRRQGCREIIQCACKFSCRLETTVDALKTRMKEERLEGLTPCKWNLFCKLTRRASLAQVEIAHCCNQLNCRMFLGVDIAAGDKYLGFADPDARIIVKGGRQPVLGYHPQLARSGHGLVVGFELDPETLNDARSLKPLAESIVLSTGKTPKVLATDDGYTSKENMDMAAAMGIGLLVNSGAKGRRLAGEELWNSEEHREARRWRSSVESLMSWLKNSYGMDRMRRTGVEAVRAEMLETILAYNCTLMVRMRQGMTKSAA